MTPIFKTEKKYWVEKGKRGGREVEQGVSEGSCGCVYWILITLTA